MSLPSQSWHTYTAHRWAEQQNGRAAVQLPMIGAARHQMSCTWFRAPAPPQHQFDQRCCTDSSWCSRQGLSIKWTPTACCWCLSYCRHASCCTPHTSRRAAVFSSLWALAATPDMVLSIQCHHDQSAKLPQTHEHVAGLAWPGVQDAAVASQVVVDTPWTDST